MRSESENWRITFKSAWTHNLKDIWHFGRQQKKNGSSFVDLLINCEIKRYPGDTITFWDTTYLWRIRFIILNCRWYAEKRKRLIPKYRYRTFASFSLGKWFLLGLLLISLDNKSINIINTWLYWMWSLRPEDSEKERAKENSVKLHSRQTERNERIAARIHLHI